MFLAESKVSRNQLFFAGKNISELRFRETVDVLCYCIWDLRKAKNNPSSSEKLQCVAGQRNELPDMCCL